MYICVLNNVTAIKTNQHLPIFKISKGDITSRDLNPKTVEIDMEENENTYEDENSGAEDVLLNSFQTFKRSDDGIGSECSTSLPVATVDTSISDNEDTEEKSKGDKGNSKVDKNHDNHGENEEHVDHRDTVKAETNIEMRSIMDAVQKLSGESNVRKTITILDFAGHDIYYAFHQIYLSGATFSILVVDMSKEFEDPCKPTNVSDDDFCCSRFESWTYKGNKYKRPFTCCNIRIYKSDFVEENLSNLCFFICRIL